jgi:hypothetical protein
MVRSVFWNIYRVILCFLNGGVFVLEAEIYAPWSYLEV